MKEADKYGGEDIPEPPEKEKRSCDKWNHFWRSVFHQPNHLQKKLVVLGPVLTSHNWNTSLPYIPEHSLRTSILQSPDI